MVVRQKLHMALKYISYPIDKKIITGCRGSCRNCNFQYSLWWKFFFKINMTTFPYQCRADSRFVPSQWDTALLCNDVSHWQGASLESALQCISPGPLRRTNRQRDSRYRGLGWKTGILWKSYFEWSVDKQVDWPVTLDGSVLLSNCSNICRHIAMCSRFQFEYPIACHNDS